MLDRIWTGFFLVAFVAAVFQSVVLGHTEYYPRFGFRPSKTLRCRYTDDAAFMVLDLGGLEGVEGMVEYHPAFK